MPTATLVWEIWENCERVLWRRRERRHSQFEPVDARNLECKGLNFGFERYSSFQSRFGG
jgi:hypothetical protein